MFSVYTAFPRGFCAGVNRAVHLLDDVIKIYGAPVYLNHEIIHNKFIVDSFAKKWVIYEENIENIPSWSLVVVSAHWVWPSYYASLKQRWLRYIDATCPLVMKVHLEAFQFIKKGYKIIYIGKKDHQEALWILDEDRANIVIISNKNDVDALHYEEGISLVLLSQTTLSVDDTKELVDYIQKKYPQIVLPLASDICYATTNRQNAVKKLSEMVDVVFIIGSKNSSNSNKLKLVAESLWKKAYLIDDASEIDIYWLEWADSVWVASWASGPEELVQEVLSFLVLNGWVFKEELRVAQENTTFPYEIKIQK